MEKKTIDHLLRATWQAIARMYNEEASKYNSTMATGFALLSIDPKKGTPSTALGPKMGMESTSLSRTLKFMEEESLIERLPNPDDGRGILIKLTKRGIDYRNYAKDQVMKFNKTIIGDLGEEAINNFLHVINQINKLIKNKKIF